MKGRTPQRPRFKAHLTLRVVAPDTVFLVSEDDYHLVRDPAAAAIAPYLNGCHTIAEIVEAVGSRATFTDSVLALSRLGASGHIAERVGSGLGRPAAAVWDSRGVDPDEATRRLASSAVTLTALGEIDVDPTLDALAASGVRARLVPRERIDEVDAGLAVVLTDEYLDQRLAEVDAKLRAVGRSWLLTKPNGNEIWIGPYFRPGRTGCWHCLHQRLDGNRPVGQYLRRVTGNAAPVRAPVMALEYTMGIASNLVAGAVVTAVVTGELPALEGILSTLHTEKLQTTQHQLIRQPQCPACGDVTMLERDPAIRIGSCPVAFHDDSGYRVMPPETTFRRLEKHISRLLGAVTNLRPLSGGDGGLTHSYSAGHNFATQYSVHGLRRTLRGLSGGKGRTEIQAKTSAVCEAIERYCAVWREGVPAAVARYADLGPEQAVHVADLLLFSPDQYANREPWNRASAGRLHRVPHPFDTSREVSWTAAWSLTHERTRLVPAAYAWFGHPDLNHHAFCYPDSNGNAAGNTMEEAILQGFCEVIERDSVAMWWYNRARRPAVDLDSTNNTYVEQLREFYATRGRQIWALDLTADLGIPAFAAVSRRIDHPVEDVLLGFGAHVDARLALMRALTELNQFLPAVASRNPDGSTHYWEDDPATLAWWRDIRVAEEEWLLPDPDAKPTTLDTHSRLFSGDLAEDLRRCVALARTAGLEVIVCDQTRPDIELNVVKVMVPGARHFWRRLGPGRLYDVPAALGWVERPTSEDDCNPISIYF
jgi:oxazoline/thiazoline synthase